MPHGDVAQPESGLVDKGSGIGCCVVGTLHRLSPKWVCLASMGCG